MAQQTDHIGDTNKMVEHHIVDTNKMITMAQQSAVEWLFMTLALTPMTDWYNVLEQAKSMEKEQITQAHLFGLLHPIEMEATKQAEQYYNETYNK